ncbi:hypothetical protein MAHJHV57_54510 [Mycobacterium avium subsp. hominissuis]
MLHHVQADHQQHVVAVADFADPLEIAWGRRDAAARVLHRFDEHRGHGVTIYDDRGNSYLDGLSGLFTVQVGLGEFGAAVADLHGEQPGQAVETAWKLAKQYFKLTGKPGKHKVISRAPWVVPW